MVQSMQRAFTHMFLIAAAVAVLASAAPAQAGAPFSCDPAFEARALGGGLDPELKTWIVDTARRFYRDRSRNVALLRGVCAELGCVSAADIVAKVARQCSRAPDQTLEIAIQRSLRELIMPVIGCDARCAMQLGVQ